MQLQVADKETQVAFDAWPSSTLLHRFRRQLRLEVQILLLHSSGRKLLTLLQVFTAVCLRAPPVKRLSRLLKVHSTRRLFHIGVILGIIFMVTLLLHFYNRAVNLGLEASIAHSSACSKYVISNFDHFRSIEHFRSFNGTLVKRVSRQHGIPKIVHQTYKTASVPVEYLALLTDCRRMNPDWRYILWRDTDIKAFIRDHFPQYEKKYNSFKIGLQKADMMRYMVLYHYGGVYIDMDIECMRPFSSGLAAFGSDAFLDQERQEHANILYGREFTAMNSAMGAAPRHPFFLEMLRTIESVDEDVPSPGWSTGPELLTLVYTDWIRGPNASRHPVRLLPAEIFSPLADVQSHNFAKTCAKKEFGSVQKPDEVKWFKAGCRLVAAGGWNHDATNSKTIGRHRFLHLGYNWNEHQVKTAVHCNVTELHANVHHYVT